MSFGVWTPRGWPLLLPNGRRKQLFVGDRAARVVSYIQAQCIKGDIEVKCPTFCPLDPDEFWCVDTSWVALATAKWSSQTIVRRRQGRTSRTVHTSTVH